MGNGSTSEGAVKEAQFEKVLTVRVTRLEYARLKEEAAGLGLSTLVRRRLFGRSFVDRNVLMKVAALHETGLRIQLLTDNPSADKQAVALALADARAAIHALVPQLP